MKTYCVTWSIDVDAETPQAAAAEAQAQMPAQWAPPRHCFVDGEGRDTFATIFEVTPHERGSRTTIVDLGAYKMGETT